jgi:hypothetical protein
MCGHKPKNKRENVWEEEARINIKVSGTNIKLKTKGVWK